MTTLRTLILPCVLVLGACGKSAPPEAPPPFVKTVIAGAQPESAATSYSGEVRARREATLAFRVGGKLIERLVDVGTVVKPGQVLARIDPADLALQAKQTDAQRALAEADARRFRELREKNFISQAALDSKETAAQTASAQAALARNQSGYAVLKADRAGAVAQVMAEPGQVVAAGQGVLRVAEAGEIEVAIAVPESRLSGLKPGVPAEVSFWTERKPLRGRLRELSPVADPATRTFAARVTLLDADQSIALGMTANIRFALAETDVLVVPQSAIFQQGDHAAVWIVGEDDVLALRPVVLGAYRDAGATIMSGLKAGERIVAAGVHKLTAGAKVRPIP